MLVLVSLMTSIATGAWATEPSRLQRRPLAPPIAEQARVDTVFSSDSAVIDINDIRAATYPWASISNLYYPAAESNLPFYRKNYYAIGYGAVNLVFGTIRFRDTVTCGNYFFPGAQLRSTSPIRRLSNKRGRRDYDPLAKHDLEISTDWVEETLFGNIDEPTGVQLNPLGIEVHQSIYAWNASYLKRVLIIDNWIVNKSSEAWEESTIGVLASPAVINEFIVNSRDSDDPNEPPSGTICGFIPTVPGIVRDIPDTLNLVWAADNDGEAYWTKGKFGLRNPTATIGFRILSAPVGAQLHFNWWNWFPQTGPRLRISRIREPVYVGFPFSDRALYARMTNGEIDYDQVFSAMDQSAEGWAPIGTSAQARDLADGGFPDILLSVGPISKPIAPGDSVRFAYAIVMGDDFHTDPNHFANTFNYDNPAPYLNGLNFTNLISAAQWAGWFFDNPGVDTDGDGYAGEFHLVDCVGWECDTVYYSGDGVPDFKGPLPPPPPRDITYETYPTKIIARWTGSASEFARDRHARRPDWEGYKVYLAVDDTARGWSLVGSWDREDYVRYSHHEIKGTWDRNSHPHTTSEWRQILSDPEFDPLAHTMPSLTTGYRDIATDTVRTATGTIVDIVTHDRWSYFAPGAANNQNEIQDGSHMTINPVRLVGTVDTIVDDQPVTYGIYEYEIENLSQSKQFWITVTAFDYGDYRNSIDPEESIPGENALKFLAVSSADVVMDSNLKVNVHPNPYKSEFYDWQGNVATYHSQGYEYSPSGKFDERDRRIWFTNLPDTAVIEIYSLDGDLIRMIYHPDMFLTKYPSVVGWDLISRNTQAVVSGIYIWKVSSRLGSQVGKLVIIK